MSNGPPPPPPPPPNGDPETWYDEYWDSEVWWSGSEGCKTDVSVEGFESSTAELLPPVLDWIRENTEHTPTISGGHENGENECHSTACSRHYCGKAFDVYTYGQ